MERMKLTQENNSSAKLLRELGIPRHRLGFSLLCLALPRYAVSENLSLSKELYPQIAQTLSLSDWRAAEHAIREVIHYAWLHRDPEVWGRYFPQFEKAPSNKVFLAALEDYI